MAWTVAMTIHAAAATTTVLLLLLLLLDPGAIQVLEPAGVPVGPHDAKAVLVQLLWSDCDMEVGSG